jgi:hypothetical protein
VFHRCFLLYNDLCRPIEVLALPEQHGRSVMLRITIISMVEKSQQIVKKWQKVCAENHNEGRYI